MLLEVFGEEATLEEWSKRTGLGQTTIYRRLQRMPAEVAVLLPKQTHVDPDAGPGEPGSWTWPILPWSEDRWARDFVARNPHGAGQHEVGAAMGITRQRVEQVEAAARRKLMKRFGVELEELFR